jgi:hypothetical protein
VLLSQQETKELKFKLGTCQRPISKSNCLATSKQILIVLLYHQRFHIILEVELLQSQLTSGEALLEALPASNGPAVQVSPNFKVCGEEGRVQRRMKSQGF